MTKEFFFNYLHQKYEMVAVRYDRVINTLGIASHRNKETGITGLEAIPHKGKVYLPRDMCHLNLDTT